jgi:hypothetical protein
MIRVLRKIFGPKIDEASGQFTMPQNEELSDLCRSLGIVRVINCETYKWAQNVPRIVGRGGIY